MGTYPTPLSLTTGFWVGLTVLLSRFKFKLDVHLIELNLQWHHYRFGNKLGLQTPLYSSEILISVGGRLIPVRGDEWMDEHFKSKFGVYSGVSGDFEVGQTVTVQIYRVPPPPC